MELLFLNNLLARFQIEGVPANLALTWGQKVIFYQLVFRRDKRLQINCSTQYGKTLVVALACIVISCLQGEVVAVVAPSTEKAKLTMRYFIEHLGDDPIFYTRLEKNTRLERLRQEESKTRIILNNGGGIYTVSTQEKNSLKSVESAMGMGARIVIGDEYCLVSDTNEATIFRMIAGKGEEGFYCKIGNPFYSAEPYSHFKKSWEDPKYTHILINDEVAVREGRYSQEFLDEAITKPLYSILFKCEFPPLDEMDKDGYRQLLLKEQVTFKSKEEILKLFNDKRAKERELGVRPTRIKLGVDIGGGGDKSVFVLRCGELAFIVATINVHDTMANVSKVEELISEFEIQDEDISLDDIGIGRGVCDRLIELGHGINSVSVGMPADDSETFANIKAELHWRLKDWCLKGGIIEADSNLMTQIFWTKWKVQTGEKKIILEPKEFVRRRQKKSPDYNDALVLTFYEPPFIGWL